jgi:anti-anti-sigma factor
MGKTKYRHLTSRVESDVLVIAITTTQLQDEKTAKEVQDELLAAAGVSIRSNVVVDLQRLQYVSSVAFSPFLRLRRELQAAGGRMILCGLSSMVGDVFFTTRLVSPDGSFTAPFEMAVNVASAIARLKQDPAERPVATD